MRVIITVALLLFSVFANAQRIIPIGNGRVTDTGSIAGSLIINKYLIMPEYGTTNTNMVLGFDSRGKAVLRINNDSLIYATRRYVDSTANAITAGIVDSSIYSTVTRLADSLYGLRLYTDSLYTVMTTKQGADSLLLALRIDTANGNIYLLDSTVNLLVSQVATAQSDISILDSALGVAFGAISNLYDTLPYYVPYVGATQGLDLGNHPLTTSRVNVDTIHAKGSLGVITQTSSGNSIMLAGAGGGSNLSVYAPTIFSVLANGSESDTVIGASSTGLLKKIGIGSIYIKKTDTGRGATNIVTGGTLQKVADSVAALAGGGSTPISANNYELLYKSGDTIKGAANVVVDSTDKRLVFPDNADTARVLPYYDGGTKVYGSNLMGMGTVNVADTFGLPYYLQRGFGTCVVSTISTPSSGTTLVGSGGFGTGGFLGVGGTPALIQASYSSTITHLNFNYMRYTSGTATNNAALVRVGSLTGAAGILCGGNKYAGGGKGIITFCLPTYFSTQGLFVGYTRISSLVQTEPSSFLNGSFLPAIAIGKDATDTTFQVFTRVDGGISTANKINTGIVPNSSDVYRVTIYISGTSNYYLKFEVISLTGITTQVHNLTVNVPQVGVWLAPFVQATTASTSGTAVQIGLINLVQETY